MKITKTASGNKIKMSKKEWEAIGKKAGWMDPWRERQEQAWKNDPDLVDLNEEDCPRIRTFEGEGIYVKSVGADAIKVKLDNGKILVLPKERVFFLEEPVRKPEPSMTWNQNVTNQ